jgi:hypothetical protein
MYIHNCTGNRQKATQYMGKTRISCTSPDGYRDVIGLPRCGGSSSQISKEKEATGIIADHHIKYLKI